MNGFEKVVTMLSNAYISVYGIEKWNSLTAQEKHDAVMFIATDLHTALTRLKNSED